MNGRDLSDYVRSMMKTRQDNDMVDCIGAIYAENKIKLLWLIGLGTIYAKIKTELSGPIWLGVVSEEKQTKQ